MKKISMRAHKCEGKLDRALTFMPSTASSGMSKGAGRPGIRAVATMMSESAVAARSISFSAALYSSLISLA